ncbi:MAG: ABC transporter ATP-binding protein [Coriobacteriia bacterium]|nr:ABC transporter ATP-binding protein [Coriobacteriia bacterium]
MTAVDVLEDGVVSTTGESLAILIEHARKDYGKAAGGRREAVADVTIEVSRGAIHGLLGPNGAGKTTTLKMLLGLVRPSGGRFEILGAPAGKPGARARLGFLPESPYFPSQLTAGEAMALSGRLCGLSRTELVTQSAELLDRVGLDGRQRTPLSRFSRGMLQRLGLAAALLGKPEVLILDEPASGLDPVGQRDVRNLMVELKNAGATILLSSHQLSEVEAISDEVTILNRGIVAARGHIDALLNIEGRMSVTARGEGALPDAVRAYVGDIAVDGSTQVFSVAEDAVRGVVDALDDGGWRTVSVLPMRASLEDYFAGMLAATEPEQSPEQSEGGDSW